VVFADFFAVGIRRRIFLAAGAAADLGRRTRAVDENRGGPAFGAGNLHSMHLGLVPSEAEHTRSRSVGICLRQLFALVAADLAGGMVRGADEIRLDFLDLVDSFGTAAVGLCRRLDCAGVSPRMRVRGTAHLG